MTFTRKQKEEYRKQRRETEAVQAAGTLEPGVVPAAHRTIQIRRDEVHRTGRNAAPAAQTVGLDGQHGRTGRERQDAGRPLDHGNVQGAHGDAILITTLCLNVLAEGLTDAMALCGRRIVLSAAWRPPPP